LASLVSRDGRRFELKAGRVTTIGRSLDNDVVLQHKSVSRRHATIQWANRGFSVNDLNSSNGTWVGHRRIGSVQLADGDAVRFGDIELAFEDRERRSSGANKVAEGATDAQKRIGLRTKAAAATAALAILGLGAWQLLSTRVTGTTGSAAQSNARSDTGSTPNVPGANPSVVTPPRTDNQTAVGGVPVAQVGEALIETDSKHAGEHLWIRLDSIAEVCDAGGFPSDSLLCREAYLGRHTQGRDLDRGPREDTVQRSEIAELCSRGMIDQTFELCSKLARNGGLGQ
jgi:pSer/pThr/pTyr-binding forkhead associated (FHA) protein